ncbi:MAG: hypothetical protein BAW33_01655 [Desulfobacterales bacterium C00003104]|nr:MAG: hypothetical protein BAW33_01655 [Desulfobacterales bacterium C00003104]
MRIDTFFSITEIALSKDGIAFCIGEYIHLVGKRGPCRAQQNKKEKRKRYKGSLKNNFTF